jgi:hypothetical protein
MGLCPAHIVGFPTISPPDRDSGFQPAALIRSISWARFCSLPALVYSVGGAADAGGVGGDGYRLGAFSNASTAWADIEGLPGILSTKVFVLLL